MSVKRLRAKPDGTIAGYRAIGFHGRLGTNQTPARRGAVLADAKDRHLLISEASPTPSGGSTLTVELGTRPIPADVWETTGTRIDPSWPAVLGHIFVIVGEREASHADLLATRATDRGMDETAAFLRWLSTGTDRSEELRCSRVGDLVAWYCALKEAWDLWRLLVDIARAEVLECATQGDALRLKNSSFWLSRAAVEDADIFLAVAGLRQAAYPHWEGLLEAGVRNGTKASRLAAVDTAQMALELPPGRTASNSMTSLPMSRMASHAIKSSLIGLRDAAERAIQRAA